MVGNAINMLGGDGTLGHKQAVMRSLKLPTIDSRSRSGHHCGEAGPAEGMLVVVLREGCLSLPSGVARYTC